MGDIGAKKLAKSCFVEVDVLMWASLYEMQLNRITHIKQLEQKMRDRLKNIDRTDRESSPNKKDKEREWESVRKREEKEEIFIEME